MGHPLRRGQDVGRHRHVPEGGDRRLPDLGLAELVLEPVTRRPLHLVDGRGAGYVLRVCFKQWLHQTGKHPIFPIDRCRAPDVIGEHGPEGGVVLGDGLLLEHPVDDLPMATPSDHGQAPMKSGNLQLQPLDLVIQLQGLGVHGLPLRHDLLDVIAALVKESSFGNLVTRRGHIPEARNKDSQVFETMLDRSPSVLLRIDVN